jgi:hypothetical protein
MKTANKTLLTLLALAFTFSVQSQYMGASVGYMKVKPGQWSNYQELEKQAKEIHQARVDKGIITQWHLYEKLYAGADDPYDFIVVAFFDDYQKTEKPFPQELVDEMFTSEDQAAFMKKAGETRTQVKFEYYDQVLASEVFKPAKYIRINRYKVKPGEGGSYQALRKEFIKPLFDEFIKNGHLAGWSLWHKLTYDREFQYVSVDAFEEFGQWKSGMPYQETWNEIHPDKEMSEIQPKLRDSRMHVNSEYWKLVEFTVPKPE